MAQETSDGVPISDGFDYPVGPRGANVDVFKTHKVDTILVDDDYFKNLGYWHPGEDWNGKGGGDTDLGDPIYAISNGKVIDFGHYSTWGNIVLIEHALPDNSRVWSQYAHLDKIMVGSKGQNVDRGTQIGTMGKGDKNRYLAHLHFEIRKNKLPIGNWSPMVKDKNAVLANYYSPMDFIKSHRPGSAMFAQPAAKPAPAQPASKPAAVPQAAPAQLKQLVITTENTDPALGAFKASQTSTWNKAPNGFSGKMLWTAASSQQQHYVGEWSPKLPAAGAWEVWAYVPGNFATTTYARYEVEHANGKTEIPINQGSNQNQWVILGAFNFAPDKAGVRLSDVTGELQGASYMVGFDAVCFTKVG